MILSTHIVIAAAATKPLTGFHPILTFVVSVVSHYLTDAIPHWHYPVGSIDERDNTEKKTWRKDRRALARDFLRFALDGFGGAALAFLLIRPESASEAWWLAAAVIGSTLPDALQGMYMAGLRFLKPLQVFHDRVHSKIKLDAYPWIGIPFQLAIAGIAIWFLR